MKIKLEKGAVKSYRTDLLALGLFEGEKTNEFLNQCGKEVVNEVDRLVKTKEFRAEFSEMKILTLLGRAPAGKLLLAGLGKKKEFSLEKLRRLSANAHKAAKHADAKNYASVLHHLGSFSRGKAVFVSAEGVLLADYEFNLYKTEEKDKIKTVDSLTLLEKGKVSPALTEAVRKAEIISQATNYVRDLVNLPANVVNPLYLAREALKLNELMRVKVFDAPELERMGCNGILAVGQGSGNPPKMIVLEYNPQAKNSLAIVGKGVTFDSGGLSLKPSKYMEGMKQDMAGAGAVLGVMKAAAELKLKMRIVGVIPAVENMPGGKAYRPDDIIKMYNKKTIEVNSTDAEGRIILADALSYAETMKPKRIIDIATLTGASVVALGYFATALMTTDEPMAADLARAGEETGDRIWRLPLWEEYMEMMKSDIADLRNSGKSYDAGTIEGAVFLSHFVEKTPWAHLDIGSTGFWHEPKFYTPKGGTGAGVRLLLNYLENMRGE